MCYEMDAIGAWPEEGSMLGGEKAEEFVCKGKGGLFTLVFVERATDEIIVLLF